MNTFTPDSSLGTSTNPGFFPDPSLSRGSGVSPNQSAMALGHSNGQIKTFIGSAGQSVASNPSLGGELSAAGPELGNFAGTMVNDALRFAQSAVHAPADILNGLQGKGPDTQTLPNFTGEGQQTIQGESVQTASDVFEGKTSPIMGALKSVGSTIGGALNFIGGELGGKAAANSAPGLAKEAGDLAEKGTAAATDALKNRSTGLATKRVSSTAETMTKSEREAAIKEGRMSPAGSGGKYMPSATEKRSGEILSGKTYANPVKTVQAVSSEIASRGKEAEEYLSTDVKQIEGGELGKAFDTAKQSADKYMTSAESGAYDEQIGVFGKVLGNYTEKGQHATTADLYKALKDYEGQVTANLPKGKDALLVPGGSARIQAAKDVRSVVRDMIGQKNPEFKGKMFDLASLYDAQDNVISKAEKLGTFAKRHPVLSKTATYGAEAVGAGAIYEGAKKIGVPLP